MTPSKLMEALLADAQNFPQPKLSDVVAAHRALTLLFAMANRIQEGIVANGQLDPDEARRRCEFREHLLHQLLIRMVHTDYKSADERVEVVRHVLHGFEGGPNSFLPHLIPVKNGVQDFSDLKWFFEHLMKDEVRETFSLLEPRSPISPITAA